MSVARIGETQAKPETIPALRDFLISIMPGIQSSQDVSLLTYINPKTTRPSLW